MEGCSFSRTAKRPQKESGLQSLRAASRDQFFERVSQPKTPLNAARIEAGHGPLLPATIALPVLEDANSIQVSLMQIMRFLVSGQIDHKTAGLLLYALQTASANLSRTTFEPYIRDVVFDPRALGENLLGEHIWDDSDFEEEEEEADDEEGAEAEADEAEVRTHEK